MTTSASQRCLTRRSAVLGLAGFAIGAPAIIRPRAARADYNFDLAPPLRSHAPTSGIKYGCAGAAPSVQPDRVLLEHFAIEANIFAPESALKWNATEPQPGAFDFSEGDSIAVFAARNDMLVHGHTLVWYAAIPEWVAQITTAQQARTALERHITTEVSRYRGKIWAWDVVNESIGPNDRLDHDYRNSVWLRALGIDYIDLSFRLARAVDPATPLALSDYGIEYATAECQRRRQALLALLQKLRDQKTPIDCLALQSHLECHKAFDRRELTTFLHGVVALGYRVLITELDVNDVKVPVTRPSAMSRSPATWTNISISCFPWRGRCRSPLGA